MYDRIYESRGNLYVEYFSDQRDKMDGRCWESITHTFTSSFMMGTFMSVEPPGLQRRISTLNKTVQLYRLCTF